MALPYASANASQYVYPAGVAAALGQIVLWDPSFGLEQDPEFYEKVLRDSACGGALDHLQKLVVGHDWFLEPANDTPQDHKFAEILTGLQKQTKRLSSVWYNLAAAVWKGATWGRLRLEERVLRLGDGKARRWVVVAEIKDADKRRFRLVRGGGAQPLQVTREASSAETSAADSWRWEFHRGAWTDQTPGWWAPLDACAPRDCWLQHVVDTSERGLAYGYGLAEDLYHNLFAKTKVLRSLLQGIDRFGQGLWVHKVAGLRQGGPGGMTPEARIAAVVNVDKTYRSENVIAIDKEDEIDVQDALGEAINACLRVINYFDSENRIRILSALQTQGAESGGTGSYGKAKVEEGSEDANVAFLRSPLEEDWTRVVLALLAKRNRRNLVELGIEPDVQVPRQRFRGRKTSDPEKSALVLTTARDIRLPVLRAEAYSLLELTQPKSDAAPDELLDWTNVGQTDPGVSSALDASALGRARETIRQAGGPRAALGEKAAVGAGNGVADVGTRTKHGEEDEA